MYKRQMSTEDEDLELTRARAAVASCATCARSSRVRETASEGEVPAAKGYERGRESVCESERKKERESTE